MTDPPHAEPAPSRWRHSAAGLLAGAVALAIGQLVSALVSPAASPVFAVGSAVVDLLPAGLKEFAIQTFGSSDKAAFFVAMGIIMAALMATAGLIERPRYPFGSALFIVFGILGMIAASARADATLAASVPSLIGVIAGVIALRVLTGRLDARRVLPGIWARRTFLQVGTGSAVVAAAAWAGSGVAGAGSRRAASSRSALTLPKPAVRAKIPDGAQLTGMTAFITPAKTFYRVDTALQLPEVDAADWQLTVHGMVRRPVRITMDDLLALPLVERVVTLACVSNTVGGDLIGNAVWLGYPVRDLLDRAGVKSGADMVLSKSTDGFTAGTPLSAMNDDNRDAIVAVGMNGKPLPIAHGFPARLVVPGLYGYVSATKWVTDLELTRFDRQTGYWTMRGWSARGPIKIGSRIDVPASEASVRAGDVDVAGIAWAQHTGISRVEVRIDGGAWKTAELADVPNTDTWRQWHLPWRAVRGRHELTVRATDAHGKVQTSTRAAPAPNGASGYASINVDVTG
ncbi:molybdopterin-dependent oxidoreductase [Spelaeicoccus albus]|uniref:DMSO/TMAO reductase YedYZ molybdopterin-dependent catalytic subunit n=1 Tax=Spelaeicoccus albus TaxID=1280376 RepID=A0A7Z0A786_9MICO|nr:molybdopterin-dependent oxidoreductase [Spelaeicoccus albus]NYI65699.1 DMSO/TMAO reductase YedYZ molybdopterin-dependent catalytic subunit [Spelaeicoccus albus]